MAVAGDESGGGGLWRAAGKDHENGECEGDKPHTREWCLRGSKTLSIAMTYRSTYTSVGANRFW